MQLYREETYGTRYIIYLGTGTRAGLDMTGPDFEHKTAQKHVDNHPAPGVHLRACIIGPCGDCLFSQEL
jgi:hypothetical protein